MSARPPATGCRWHDHGKSGLSWLMPWGLIVVVMILGVAAGWFLQPDTARHAGVGSSEFDVALAVASAVAGTLVTSLLVVSLPRRRLPFASLLMLLDVVWIHVGRTAVPLSSWSAVAAVLWVALVLACVMEKRRWAAAVTVLLGGLLTMLLAATG